MKCNDFYNYFCFLSPPPPQVAPIETYNTVLYKYYKCANIYSWIIFVVYQIIIGVDYYHNKTPLCHYSDKVYNNNYWYSYYTILGAFLSTSIFILFKLFFSNYECYKTIPLITTANIILISTVSTIMSVFFNWGGICVDMFDVASPAAIWGEWASTGPLLIFLTITIDNKQAFTKLDIFIISSFFMCIVFGFCIIPNQTIVSARFLLFMSFFSYVPILYLPFYTYNDLKIQDTGADAEIDTEKFNVIFKKRKILSILLSIFMSLFSVNYLFACFGVIDYSTTIIIYQFLTYIVKGLFVFVIMDLHVNLYKLLDEIVEKKIQVSKRNFIKYIFHEIRTPLNSIVIGIDLLLESFNPDFNEKTVIHMMKTSSDNIIETLDNLISVQKIEEKKIDIKLIPMSLENSIEKVIANFDAFLKKKKINVIRRVSPNTPEFILGDVYGLENVFCNIINNAIKFSKKHKNIYIIIDSSVTDNPNVMDISISITDEGRGIEKEKIDNIFNNEIHVRPVHLNSGQGTGLGLYFCKSIVELHGGKIEINSKPEKGTQVKIIIPFTIVKMINYNIKSEKLLSCQSSRTMLFNTAVPTGDATNSIVLDAPHSTPKASFIDKKRLPPLQNIAEDAAAELSDASVASYAALCAEHPVEPAPITSPSLFASSSSSSEDIKSPIAALQAGDDNDNVIPRKTSIVEYVQAAKKHKEELMERDFKNAANLRFLVVDDSDLNCKMIIMLLHKFGIKSQYVENGKRAANKIVQNVGVFDIIMMDNLMPIMNGTEATQVIRKGGYTNLVIGITGNVMEKEKAEFVNAGADIVLSKPIKMDTLKMILKFVEKHGIVSKYCENMVLCIENGAMEWRPKSLDNIV